MYLIIILSEVYHTQIKLTYITPKFRYSMFKSSNPIFQYFFNISATLSLLLSELVLPQNHHAIIFIYDSTTNLAPQPSIVYQQPCLTFIIPTLFMNTM